MSVSDDSVGECVSVFLSGVFYAFSWDSPGKIAHSPILNGKGTHLVILNVVL